MKKKQIYSSVLIVALIILFFYGYAQYTRIFPSTDDAYMQANTVNIAAQISGPVKNVFVYDHELVKSGQLLFTIDPAPFEIAVQKADANLAQIRAELDTQQKDTARILQLVREGQAPKASGDDAQGKLNQLNAGLAVAKSILSSAKLDLAHTQITAPSTGYLTHFTLRTGQMVQGGNFLFALIENNQWWVDANFKETDLKRIKSGQSAKIKLDMYPGLVLTGKVQAISTGSGAAFSILPPENATGNWVKVVQRFPVRIDVLKPDARYPLRVGASCEVTVNTR